MVNEFAGRPDLSWIYLYGDRGNFSTTLVPVDAHGNVIERFGVR